MSAYAIAQNKITDAALFAEFRERAGGIVEAHGGKFLARSSTVDVIVGDWAPDRVIVAEFDSIEQAKKCYNSSEYTENLKIHAKSAKGSVIIVEGV